MRDYTRMSYDLNKLNDKEFEVLAAQFVSEVTGRKVERFKPGKDKGVDGRFFLAGTAEAIVQAKHWERSGISALLTALEKKEAPKVAALKPARYFLVTSVPLSRANKQAIKNIFAPYVLSEKDILGNEDIQDFLRDHPKIVEQHYNLWLASTEVLKLIFNAPIIGRSSFKLEDAVSFAPKYVLTSCHDDALKRLNATGAIIIIGEPGVGKSTLAEQLVLHYAAKDFELCFVEDDLTEAEAVWASAKKQVFYFDDFLGRNYLEAIGSNHDSHVINFMRRVSKDRSKRFILTSRTTILQQGKSLSELFRAHNIQQKEYEVRITDLTRIDKARILYNHLWFGELEASFVEQLYIGKRYQQVVAHRNFNPRLISFITDTHKIAGVQAEEYWKYALAMLENPQDVWRGVFENQINDLGRLISSLVVFHGGSISERKLRVACERSRTSTVPAPPPAEWRLRFERSFQMSVGAIVTRSVDRAQLEPQIGLFNPSVGDFIIRRFDSDEAAIESFVVLLQDEEALVQLVSLWRSKMLADERVRNVMGRLIARFWREPFEAPEFAGALALIIVRDPGLAGWFSDQIERLGKSFFSLADVTAAPDRLSALAIYAFSQNFFSRADERWLRFVRAVVARTSADEDLVELSKVVAEMSSPHKETAIEILQSHVVATWKDKIEELLRETDTATDYRDPVTESHEAQNAIRDYIRASLDDYLIPFTDDHVNSIVSVVDIFDFIIANQDSYSPDDDDDRRHGATGGGSGSEEQQIDDLFDRDR